MSVLVQRSLSTVRAVAGKNSMAERTARRYRNRLKLATRNEFNRRDAYVWRTSTGQEDLGIFAFGACDLWSVVHAGPLIREKGTHRHGCVLKVAGAAAARSDLLLQTLRPGLPSLTQALTQQMALGDRYFEPWLFEPTFSVPDHTHLGAFRKRVVVLSIAADLTRSLYRHRKHGFLVDPGGWWLNDSMQRVLSRLDDVKWFAANFEKVGRISVEDFASSMGAVVRHLREQTRVHVVVFNSLVVEPGRPIHDYRLASSAYSRRRREFNLALADLTRTEDFDIIDIDRTLKGVGISRQADFVHFTTKQKDAIAHELVRVLQDRHILR